MNEEQRDTQRFSLAVPASLMEAIESRALHEGRSLSNLVALLLERALDQDSRG